MPNRVNRRGSRRNRNTQQSYPNIRTNTSRSRSRNHNHRRLSISTRRRNKLKQAIAHQQQEQKRIDAVRRLKQIQSGTEHGSNFKPNQSSTNQKIEIDSESHDLESHDLERLNIDTPNPSPPPEKSSSSNSSRQSAPEPSPSPSPSPSNSPSKSPSNSPSKSPSKSPSNSPSKSESNSPASSKSLTPKNKSKDFIKIKNKALYMSLKQKNKFSNNNNKKNKKLSDTFHIIISKTSPRGLKIDQKKYEHKLIMKQLLLNKFTLTSIGRGSSECWNYFYCIINTKGELIDLYAFCHSCNNIYYKGHSVSNLSLHAKSHQTNFDHTNNTNNSNKNIKDVCMKDKSESQSVNLPPNVIDHLRLNSTYFVNGSYSSFEIIQNEEYLNNLQDFIDTAAEYGRFDVRGLGITPYKIKETTKKQAKSIRQDQIEILTKLCENNVLPPMSFCADLYGDAFLQRANIGIDIFVVIDWELQEIPLGVIPVEGITKYITTNGGANIETDFDESEWMNDGDEEFPGGFKTFIIFDADGNEAKITIPVKNWMNIQDEIKKLLKLFGIYNRAKNIFPFVFTTDKGGNIRLALKNMLFFLGIVCMAHRLSTVFKTALKKARDSNPNFNKWWHNMISLIGIINKSAMRSKMNPSVKSPMPTRFWTNYTMVDSFDPNYGRVKAWAKENGHGDKIQWRKSSVTSMRKVLFFGKSIIQQSESRTSPTLHLFLPNLQRLYNHILIDNGDDSSYSKLFKNLSKQEIEHKLLADINEVHLLACYLNPMTRDDIYKFEGVDKSIWDGPKLREKMMKNLIKKFKQLKILCKKEKQLPKSLQKKRGRPKKDRSNEQQFDIYDFGGSSNENTNYNSDISNDDDNDMSDDEDEKKYVNDHTKIPKEIQKYNNFDMIKVQNKFGKKTINNNPMVFYKHNYELFFILSMIVKHTYSIALTSVGSEAMFNPCGLTRTKQRATLGELLATDIHTLQQWLKSNREEN